jgi:basic membrane protein A
MRRLTTASLALTIAATGVFAGALAVTAQDGSDLKIGLVTDVGTIDDRNFNQYSWEGTLAGAEAIGAGAPQYAISQTSADIGPNIQAFVDQDYDIIVTVGFAAGADTIIAAKANPDIKFIGVDQAPCITAEGDPDGTFACEGDPAKLLPNVQGINWREQQPGYLAGIVAASISETGHIAAVGGTEVIPAVVNYIEGYANGARSVNPDVSVTVTYVSGAPDAAAFNDPAGGQSIASQLLLQDPDIDVMFQVAGKTGNGVLQAACDAGIYAIGVDVDQFLSTPETAACTVVSAEKKLVKNVSDAVQRIAAGEDKGGILRLGIDTQDVGLSPFHDFEDLISQETRDAIAAAEAALADGSLKACEEQEGTGFCIQTLP